MTVEGPIPTDELFGPFNEVEARNAPPEVWIAGDRALARGVPGVSIVGTRNPTELGAKRARKLARELVEHGIVVVSGLARGVDTAAHTGALQAGGRTIAVIGTPIDKVYPKENAALQAEIARNHLLVSQFAPGRPIQPGNFPIRNRLMALVSAATVIVEAGETSGSLSQGYEALRLGRPLFLMRSVVQRADLAWPAKMLGFGAIVLDTTDDLLECIPVLDLPADQLAF